MHLKNDPAPRELCNAVRSFGPTDAEIPAPAVSVKAQRTQRRRAPPNARPRPARLWHKEPRTKRDENAPFRRDFRASSSAFLFAARVVPLEHEAIRLRRSCPLRPNRTKTGPRALNPRHSTQPRDEKTGYSPETGLTLRHRKRVMLATLRVCVHLKKHSASLTNEKMGIERR